MVRVQCVLWPRGAAEAAPVQAELWEQIHHGPPTALCQPHPTRVHTGLSAQCLLPLGGQLGLELGRSATLAHDWELHLLMCQRTWQQEACISVSVYITQTERERGWVWSG